MSVTPDSFVPLVAAETGSAKVEEFHVLIAQTPEKARSLRDLNSSPSTSIGEHPRRTACEARVTLQRDGDRITSIQVHCSCGQIIDLLCAYPAEPTAPPPASSRSPKLGSRSKSDHP